MKMLDLNGGFPQTDEEAMEYLPDHDPIMKTAAQGLYQCRRKMGDSIIDALIAVLEAAVKPRQNDVVR
jgi:hypothetical protein